MLVGVANMLVVLWEAEHPRAVFVGWDTIGPPTYRHELLPSYQSGREFPPELLEQLDRLPELCSAFGFSWGKASGYEADDFLAAVVAAEEARGGTCLVVTSDRDMFQLASDRTTLLLPRRGVYELDRVDPAGVVERYGVEPAQVPDFIALRGDSSDRIPGAPGVGAVRAAGVLRRHGTLEAALGEGGFPGIADDLRRYREIATLRRDAPIEPVEDAEPDWRAATTLAETWGLNALAKRLREREG
jgi:DNA polymerase-1